jgi:hypothetical protein
MLLMQAPVSPTKGAPSHKRHSAPSPSTNPPFWERTWKPVQHAAAATHINGHVPAHNTAPHCTYTAARHIACRCLQPALSPHAWTPPKVVWRHHSAPLLSTSVYPPV